MIHNTNTVVIVAGTNRASSGTLSFSNANGVTFGMDTNNVITASALGGGAGGIGLSVGTQSITAGVGVFSNGNGVTFGMNNSTVTASVQTNYQSQGAYLTTAMASNAGSNFLYTSNLTQLTAGANITLSQVGSTVTIIGASGGAGGGAVVSAGANSQSTGTVNFANSNGISFGLSNNGTLTASYAQTQITGGNSISLSQIGNTVTIYGPVFSNSNGMAFGSNGGTITASYSVGTALSFSKLTTAPAAPAAGVGELYSIDDNGITFFEYQDSAGETIRVDRDLIISVQNNTGSTINKGQWVAFATNSSTGVTRIILARADSTTTTPCVGIMLDTVTTGNFGRCMISGVARGLNTSAFTDGDRIFLSPTVAGGVQVAIPATLGQFAQRVGIVIQANPSQGIILVSPTAAFPIVAQVGVAAGASTVTNSNVVFSNANNVTFGLAGSTITASVNGAGVALGAGSQTVSTGSVNFVNSNNITFGMSNSSQITASYAVTQITGGSNITLAQAGSTVSINGPVFGNANGITFGTNSNTVTASFSITGGAGGAAIQGSGTYSQNTGTVQFANSNNMTFGLSNNGTMTASYAVSQITAGSNITLSQVGSTISIIGNPAGGIAAGVSTLGNTAGNTGIFTTGTLVFAASNSATLSMSTGTGNVHTIWFLPLLMALSGGPGISLYTTNGSQIVIKTVTT